MPGVCRHLEISVPTYQRWRYQFKAMRPEDVVRPKALEKESARLKRLLADKELDNDMFREVARENTDPGATPAGGGAPDRPLPGLSVRGPAPVHPAPLPGPCVRRGPPPLPRPPTSPLWLSAHHVLLLREGWGRQSQACPAPVAGRRPPCA